MGLNICPYYYKDGISNKEKIYFEYCHKPKSEKECPDGRLSNHCKILTMEFQNTYANVDLINEIMNKTN